MAKLALRTQATLAIAVCGIVAAACGNKDDGGGSTTVGGTGGAATGGAATGGVTGATGGSAAGGTPAATGGSTQTSACEGLSVKGGSNPLIDDLEHDGVSTIPEVDMRKGSWFTANDGTLGGMQEPAAAMAFPTASVGRGDTYGFATTSDGFEEWGANFGLSLNDVSGAGCAYDASDFDGISFWAKSGDGETYSVKVSVPIPAIIPLSRGGLCSGEGCDDGHAKYVTITGEWQEFKIMWNELRQNAGWSHDNKYDFDEFNIAQITWATEGTTLGKYNLVIDDVMFLGGGSNMGGMGGNQ